MNDDREVTCYVLLAQHLAGRTCAVAARRLAGAQRDLDDGCTLLAATLLEARVFSADDAWGRVHAAAEFNRPRSVRAAAALLGKATEKAVAKIVEQPDRYLNARPPAPAAAPPRRC